MTDIGTLTTPPATSDNRPLGRILVDAGRITERQLGLALDAQKTGGGRLGQNLILAGAVTRLELYDCLATQLNVPFVNLLTDVPDAGILEGEEPADLIRAEWIPFHRTIDSLTIATSVPFSDAMRGAAMKRYGVRNIVLNVTTDWDISQAVTRYCRSRLLFNAAEELATTAPGQSAKAGLALWQKILGGILVVALIAGMIWATAGTIIVLLVLANIFFLIAVLFRTFSAIMGAVQRHDDAVIAKAIAKASANKPPVPPTPDAELPTYTILVPVFHEANVITTGLAQIQTAGAHPDGGERHRNDAGVQSCWAPRVCAASGRSGGGSAHQTASLQLRTTVCPRRLPRHF
jgi:hypothetical protein